MAIGVGGFESALSFGDALEGVDGKGAGEGEFLFDGEPVPGNGDGGKDLRALRSDPPVPESFKGHSAT
jgi:hypothetical protein